MADTPDHNPLAASLAAAIRRDGPLPVSRFMAAAANAYYAGRDPFGAAGDFTTAPEISQMFGELIGVWAAVVWQQMGMPEAVILAELGPGRGTLMADCLRASATLPAFRAALRPWLIETSPLLRRRQQDNLPGKGAQWAERIEDLPPGPLLLIANEFFDALPIAQWVKQGDGWHERCVGLDSLGAFTFVTGPAGPAPPLTAAVLAAPSGSIAETCGLGVQIAAWLGQRLAQHGGAALVIDYGHGQSAAGDTLQALRQHRFHPVLADPGKVDITAHVDFQALGQAAHPARAWGPVPQGIFLRRLGIEARAARLAQSKRAAAAQDILGRMHRLIDDGEMGTLFKVMALAHPAQPVPPGFDSL